MRGSTTEESSVYSVLPPGSVNTSTGDVVNFKIRKSGVFRKRIVEAKTTTESAFLFWKQQLDLDTPLLEIPSDFTRTATASCVLEHVPFSLSPSCRDALQRISAQLDTTLFATLLAAYNTLLFRYTGKESIVVGYPTLKNVFDKTGELTDTLHHTKIFRTDLSSDPGFIDLLKRVHQTVLMGEIYSSVPYETLEETMKIELGVNYAGLYNVTFSFRNTRVENNGLVARTPNIGIPENLGGTIDLALFVEEALSGLNGVWTYNSGLFEAATIRRLAEHFEVLLESIVSDPEQTISQLQLLTGKEYHQLTAEWNKSTVKYPSNKCIHELFEDQVKKTPEAIALIFEKEELTYAELNERANQLAHYLCSRGVKQETLVPLCIGRSAEMIVGMLAILKAGGAYVPIDPNYPLERIAFMLNDTAATMVVCNKESKVPLEAFQNIDLVELTPEGSLFTNQPTYNLNTDLSSGNLAYIIYTSGSTGQPKGVMVEHKALADHCYGVIDSANLKTCKSFALFSPLVFDAGHSIIHSAFILGAGLHVLSDEVIMNCEKVTAYLDHHAVDCIKIVPSLWLSYANLQKITVSKKVMIFGGEAFHLGILNDLIKVNYTGDIYNHYGPTEVTVGKCIYKVDLDKTYRTVPIGKPFSNTQLYILDDHLQLLPQGIDGELYVAGDGLARGYLNQPVLTAGKFIPNPFASNPTGKMYKTGDKVRWLSDGNIEYLGRADEQVKIQGHRIELGEIEDALLQNESVRQAVVLANSNKKGNRRLVAYIVPKKPFTAEAIADFLRKKLPEYMIPVSCIELEALPLTKNGKINKRELEKLEETRKMYVAPKDSMEADLAVIWQELLKIEKISVHDDFFELGGDSILAVILLAKIKKKFHKNLPLAFLLKARTINQLATELKGAKEALSSYSSLVPIQPNGSKTPLFGIHAGSGDILFYGSLSQHLGQDQPFYGLQAKGINGIKIPSTQMEQMAGYYISEIRKVQPEGPYYLAGYCLGARIAFEMAQQLTSQGQKVGLLANFNGISPTYSRLSNVVNVANQRTSKSMFARAAHHLGSISKLSLKEKLSYMSKRFRVKVLLRFAGPFFLLRYKVYGLVFKSYIIFKQKVPTGFARIYTTQSLNMLQYRYKPKAYPGSMVIFRSPGIFIDPYLGWRDFVNGEIKTFDIQGKHAGRRDIINEPFVQYLAGDLKKFLDGPGCTK